MSGVDTPAKQCDFRCEPPCGRCLHSAAQIARGMGPSHLYNPRRAWWAAAGWTAGCIGAAALVLLLFPSLSCVAPTGFIVLWGWGMDRAVHLADRRVKRGACYSCGYSLTRLPRTRVEHDAEPLHLVKCPECGRWNGVRRS